MIVGADHRVRNAFRATLIDEPSSPSLVLATQEVDAADVLEVADLASAIARAEEVIRSTRSSHALLAGPESSGVRDIFDHLTAAPSSTDDCSGPAVHAPYRPTPIPPPPPVIAAPLLPPPAQLPPPVFHPAASIHGSAMDLPPAARTAPILVLDEDAFYHPAGRIRGFAEVTLDGYRPEPTLLLRLRGRRTTLSWIVMGVLAPVALLALFAMAIGIGRAQATAPQASISPPAAAKAPVAVVTAAAPNRIAPATAALPLVPTAPAVPVFDVNSLKSAPPVKPRH